MKNISFILGAFITSILIFPHITYGDSGSCKILNKPADSLENYVKNTRKTISNINADLLRRADEKTNSEFYITGSNINRMYNEMINWDGFFTDFDYYIGFQLFNSIPSQVERDLALLENETEGLRKYLDTLIDRGYANLKIEKEIVCKDINNCSLQGNTINIVGEMIKNNTKITTLYKQIVTNPKKEAKSYNIDTILTEESNENFIINLVTNYGATTIEDCAQGDTNKGFSEIVDETIDAITLNNKNGEEGIEKWTQAWDILTGVEVGKETYAAREERLLRDELSRQGISLNAQDAMVKNLKDFNTKGYNLDNNFVANSFEAIYGGGVDLVEGFQGAIDGLFQEDRNSDTNSDISVGIDSLLGETEKRETENQIINRLDILHRTHLEFAQVDSTINQKVIANIIKMHISLEGSKNKLQSTCELAVKVCNDQGKGKGNCGSCK